MTDLTAPGVYDGIPDAEYHSHSALSSTGARLLLPPSTPAHYRWAMDHPRDDKEHFDIGHAVHKYVLGVGPTIVEIPFEDWRTKAARELRDAAYANGQVPLLSKKHDMVRAMADAVKRHPLASKFIDPDQGGAPEQTLLYTDPTYDVAMRVRVDWLRLPDDTGRLILVDLKTTEKADLRSIEKSIGAYRYDVQMAFYARVILGLELADTVPVVLIFVEKTPPHLVQPVELDAQCLCIGSEAVDQALETYAECSAAGEWPGYPTDEIPLAGLPPYLR